MEPSAFARWRYIHSSAPSGSAVTSTGPVATCSVPSLLVTAAVPAAKRITRAAAAATIAAYFFSASLRLPPLRLARVRPHRADCVSWWYQPQRDAPSPGQSTPKSSTASVQPLCDRLVEPPPIAARWDRLARGDRGGLGVGRPGREGARETPHDPCQAPRAAPPAETALMPAGLSFDQIGTVTRVRKDERHVMVQAVTTKPLDEVTVLIQDAVTAAGYRPAGMDNEGFEAEVFFTTGSYAAGQALVRGRCKGRWDIDLVLLDRDAVRSPTTGSLARRDIAVRPGCAPTAPRRTVWRPRPRRWRPARRPRRSVGARHRG